MLVPTNDPNAQKRLQDAFLIAATRESHAALAAVVEDVVRFKNVGVEIFLRLRISHPLAHIVNDMFEARGLSRHYSMV